MKKLNILLILLAFSLWSCTDSANNQQKSNKSEKQTVMNPFFTEYNTAFDVPPFDKIKNEHYLPAFKKGIEEQNKEIADIVSNSEAASFKNTIEALEASGKLLRKVEAVFENQMSANTNDELQEIAEELSPILSRHNDEIFLNDKLFARVKAVYDKKADFKLNTEQSRLLDKYYKRFVRGGALLSEKDKEELKKINQELSSLSLKFGKNVLAETNKYKLVIDNKEDLAGLPEGIIAAAAETAKTTGDDGKWVFTIHRPSFYPFLQYSQKRNLREQLFKAYINKGNHNDTLDNKKIAVAIAKLRLQKAKLLGYKTHADFILSENMAKNADNVYKLMREVWAGALPAAKKEIADMQAIIDKEGGKFKLEPWDWWYYAEKVRKQKYELDEEILRPYFSVNNVRDGAFMVANKLYGITIKEINNVPKPHPDAQSFEVLDADGSHIGILFMDFHPRASKRGGAWMNAYKSQRKENGKMVSPIITTVFNFTKPIGNNPSLITFDEASTLFHELGHAFHGLLSNCTYRSLSGTNTTRDYVEFPSQIMENWAAEPEVLKAYAKHYKTGEQIPDSLIQKLSNSKYFNQGFATTEFLAAAFLDMAWHTLNKISDDLDAAEFELRTMNEIGMIPEIVVRYRTTYFNHIFSGGYSAGYYSYVWSEVLEKDAFDEFVKNGILDRETGMKFRKNILETGSTDDQMKLYINFKGKKPTPDALLRGRGFKK